MTVLSGLSVAEAKLVADSILGAAAYTPKVTLYLALMSTAPADGAAGTEATGTAYARVAVTNNATNVPAATGSTTPVSKTLHIQFAFPQAGGSWSAGATMKGVGLYDASSAGNLVAYAPITTPIAIGSTDTPTFPADSLTFTFQ